MLTDAGRAKIAATTSASNRRRLADRLATGKKHCAPRAGCGEWKPLDDFPRNAGTPDGRGSLCKPCNVRRASAWRLRRREAEAERLEAERQAAERAARRAAARIVVNCCGGALVNDPELSWWRAEHEPGCQSGWQPPVPGRFVMCSADGCRRGVFSRSLCQKHYLQARERQSATA